MVAGAAETEITNSRTACELEAKNEMKNRKAQSENGSDVSGGGDFESSLVALERIVGEMERGDLPLERSLELFEQGVRLSRECQERLNAAERRIEVLLRDSQGRTIVESLDERATEHALDDAAEDDESVF